MVALVTQVQEREGSGEGGLEHKEQRHPGVREAKFLDRIHQHSKVSQVATAKGGMHQEGPHFTNDPWGSRLFQPQKAVVQAL